MKTERVIYLFDSKRLDVRFVLAESFDLEDIIPGYLITRLGLTYREQILLKDVEKYGLSIAEVRERLRTDHWYIVTFCQ